MDLLQQSAEAIAAEASSCSDTTDSESDSEIQQPTANNLKFRSLSKASGVVHQFSSDNYLFKRRCIKSNGLAYFTCISQRCTVKFTAKYLSKSETDKPPTIISQPDNSLHTCQPCPAEKFIRDAKDVLKRRSQEEGSLQKIFYEVMQHYTDTLSPAMFRFFARDMPTEQTMIANMWRWRKGHHSADPANELPPRAADPANELPPRETGITSTCKEKRLASLRHQTPQQPHHTEPRTCRTTSRVCNDCGKKYSIYLSRHICK